MMIRRSWRFLMVLTGGLFLMQAFPMPGVVRNAADFSWPSGFHMEFPTLHLLFTPFCSLSDSLTVLSVKEQIAFQVFVFILLLVLAGIRRGLLFWLGWLIFIAWGALVPHPMARLVSDNPRLLLIDFHSHSQYSHDGRHSFTPEANMRWHREQGYNAAFITDHNRIEASEQAHAQSLKDWRETGYYSLMGEEISLYKTHLVLLGNHTRVDNKPYDSDYARIPAFLKDMQNLHWVVIASLPEYWLYHWGDGVQSLVNWGINGFEIVNSAPKALDFPLEKRRQIIALCREKNLPMTGISDNHGYGYATAVWNTMSISSWRRLDPDQLELTILLLLQKKGFEAVDVLERPKFWPENLIELVFSPLMNVIVYLRGLTVVQRIAWTVWLWGLWLAYGLIRKNLGEQKIIHG
jgi:hypothetical protein